MKVSEAEAKFAEKGLTVTPGYTYYRIPDSHFDLYGVFYDNDAGRFLRMPRDIAANVSPNVMLLNEHPVGGRLRFSTNADRISLIASYNELNHLSWMDQLGSGGFTLHEERIENGEVKQYFAATIVPGHYCFLAQCSGPNSYYLEKKLPAGGEMRNYILYFPLYNDLQELILGFPKGAKVGHGLSYRKDVKPILYYGSSITHGQCASRPDNAYPSIISKWTNVDFINLGFSASAMAEDAINEYMASLDISLFVCDYDYNADNPEYLLATHEKLYRTFRRRQKTTPIILVSDPCWETDPESQDRFNVVRRTYRIAKREGDKNVYLLCGKRLFGREDRENCTVDGTHPNDLGFYRMAQEIYKAIKKTGVLE